MKYLFILFAACITYANAFTQTIIKSQKTAGGSMDDNFTCMAFTRDGGLIEGGLSQSVISGEKTDSNRSLYSGYDYWIVKYDHAGNIQWDKTFGGIGWEQLTAIEQTMDGGYILGGYSSSNISGEKTQNSRGFDDYWIIKTDSLGNIQWDKTIGGEWSDKLYSLKQTADGGYILGGSSRSNIVGEKTENSKGLDDFWIVKTDALGNIQWDKTIGGSTTEQLYAMQQTTDGGYILGGYSFSGISGDKTDTSRGSYDYWIVKVDGFGNKQWDKTIGGSEWDQLKSLQQTTDGGYILGGYSASGISGEKKQRNRGVYDYWVVKLGSLANIEWDKTIGGTDWEELTSVEQTMDGGYILGGFSKSNISAEKSENSKGDFDYWVVKLRKDGFLLAQKTIGGSDQDKCYAVKEIDRNLFVAGGSSRSGISGDKTEASRGSFNDYWLLYLKYKPSAPASMAAEIAQHSAHEMRREKYFSVYPNPAKDILHIQIPGKATVTLTDQSGKIILTKTINNKTEIHVSKLPASLYYLKNIETGEVQKIMITR